MKAKEYVILSECVELGVELGFSRANKYKDGPNYEINLISIVIEAVMRSITEYFDFDNIEEE